MIVLGSKSPRRKQLLLECGFEFIVKHFDVEETFPETLKQQEVPLYLSLKKAESYPDALNDELLICADTIVCVDEKTINKPAHHEEAFAMLKLLSGRMHEVYTGITLRKGNEYRSFYERTEVYFKPLTSLEIEQYITHFHPYDKAGGYGIQDWIGYIGVEKIVGCYYNVMGLPLSRLYKELLDFDPKSVNQGFPR
ncbi:MAG: Maf family nucleotide pyrophosphatase [Bacteroidetes bacterium]|nr:Maf family nucleotide pyrophosphatase [Bacteroidota bacterium]